ncbi:hypothetical protein SUNI508_10316 [Seiridium unicorne]|uniref:Transmembrane protein n=1 Tax=Seiridium unicorne TaxID=138068 RepID=A0ABR2ULZ4_9PEZI
MSFPGGGGGPVSDDDNDSSGFNMGASPLAWVAVPICLLIVAALAIAFIRRRRRQRQRHSHGMTALERDLEAMGPNRVRRSASTRWQWASNQTGDRVGRRVGVGVGSREEGLNELGEAPPAYSPPLKNQEEVELHGMVVPPVAFPNDTTTSSGTQQTAAVNGSTPPSYGETRHSPDPTCSEHAADVQRPSTPPTAVLPPR